MEMQVSFERAAVAQCSEGLAEVMHDAYQCAGHLEPSQIILWKGKKRSPEHLDECNAWRAAASAAIRTLA
ncbi:hypothetical protein GCM10023213_13980 [Prosthecobacter algae]|uniref:Uncharacterized protein n=2 Tax=Prosthecobacter algae TaxID=1144682 RepID=A0ABP9NZ01_9BACT